MEFKAIGIRGDANFDDIVKHFTSMGGEVVLMNPKMIMGKDHMLSAAYHAERSFREYTNRSKTILTEIILYCAWERQIGKAMDKMSPVPGSGEYAALLIDINDMKLDSIGMVQDDSILDPTEEKALNLGMKDCIVSYEDQAIENVAMVELLKY